MMFGDEELDYYLKTESNEFLMLIEDPETKEVVFSSVKNIRAATLFGKVDFKITDFEKIHITSLDYLYYCAIEDLAELKAKPRPTYDLIDEIIAFEARIPKIKEMLEERKGER